MTAEGPDGARTVTDVRGAFTIARLRDESYTIRVTRRRRLEASLDKIRAGTQDLAIELGATGTIEGTLSGFRGAQAVMASRLGQSATDAQTMVRADVAGDRFLVSDLAAGEYRVSAASLVGESASASVTVAVGAVVSVALTAVASARIEGRVETWPDGQPVVGARCSAGGFQMPAASPQVFADASGRFAIDTVAGPGRVGCSAAPSAQAERRRVPFGAADVDVAPGGTQAIVVRIVDADRPRSSVPFAISSERPIVVSALRGDAGGLQVGDVVSAVDGIDVTEVGWAGASMLLFRHAPGTTVRVTVQRAGNVLDVDVTLGPISP